MPTGSSSTTTTQPALTPAQQKIVNNQARISNLQLSEIQRQGALQAQLQGLLDPAAARASSAAERTALEDKIESFERQVEQLRRGQFPPEFAGRGGDIAGGRAGKIASFLNEAQGALRDAKNKLAALPELGPDTGDPGLLGTLDETAARAAAEIEAQAPLREELQQITLDDLKQLGVATPEQIALIDAASNAALEKGLFDIERFESQGFETLREELAPSLGLRPSDTPIRDRGFRLGAEALRQRGQLSQAVRQAGAEARLQFPLQASAITQTFGLGQQSLQEAARQFQEELRTRAFTNRLSALQTVGGLGLGLATGFQPQLGTVGSTSTTNTSGGGFGLGEIGQLASGAGAVISAFSSRDFKTDKAPIDDEKVLEKVVDLPVESWRYKAGLCLGEETHIGTYAEDFTEGFGLGDGVTLNLMDTTGVLMSAVKALDKKVKRLEGGFGLGEDRPDEGFGLAEAA